MIPAFIFSSFIFIGCNNGFELDCNAFIFDGDPVLLILVAFNKLTEDGGLGDGVRTEAGVV